MNWPVGQVIAVCGLPQTTQNDRLRHAFERVFGKTVKNPWERTLLLGDVIEHGRVRNGGFLVAGLQNDVCRSDRG